MTEIAQYLFKKKISYDELSKYCLDRTLKQKCPELYFSDDGNIYTIYTNFTEEIAYIFKNKLRIELTRANKTFIDKTIDCHLELIKLIEDLKINLKNIFINNNEELNLAKNISYLDKWIVNGKLQLNEIILKIPKIEQKEEIALNVSYNPLELSKFFYEYFQYENKNNEKIEYINSESRKEIFQNLKDLYNNVALKKYKLTGPTSNGKSFTLFYFSRLYKNVIYLNLKVLKNQDKQKNLEMIISELSRLFLSEKEISSLNDDIQKINTDENIFKIFLSILELVLGYNIQRLVLLLDQYKTENYEIYPNFISDMESLMSTKLKKLKLVFCSSINDRSIRDDVLINLEENNGNPIYNEKTQNCLFYYGDLYHGKYNNKKEFKSINYLFDNKPKYIFLFKAEKKTQKEIFMSISNKIKEKMNTFRVSRLNPIQTPDNFTFNDIIIYMKSILNEKFYWSEINKVLSACPLKYSKIIFDKDSFIVKPIFPYIKYYINNLINKNECGDYFKKKRYNIYSFPSHRIKAEYFKYSVQQALKDNNFFELPDKERREINLYEISKMNKITDFNFDLLGEYEINEEEEIIDESTSDNNKKENFILLNENNQIEKDLTEENDNSKNSNILFDINDLNINDRNKQSVKQENIQYIQNLLDKFNIDQNFENNEDENTKYLSETMKIHSLSIEDYRNEIIKKYNNYDDNKKEIELLVKESKKNIKRFKGDENIFLTQSKENGECVDYAILFGEPNDKIFISFQMKCYGNNSSISKDAKDKIYIKNKLKKILINSIALFNCQIKHWYYYLICYYNKHDTETNNLNYKELEKYDSNNVEILLYNPEENKFFSKKKEEINKLQFTESADLEYDDYTLNTKNYLYIPKMNKHENIINIKESTEKFINDLAFLFNNKNLTLEIILRFLKKLIKADKIILDFCSYNNSLIFNYPFYYKALIYLTKKGDNCFCIANLNGKDEDGNDVFEYFNLKYKKKCSGVVLRSLNLSYYYVLSVEFDIKPEKSKARSDSPKNKKEKPKKTKMIDYFNIINNKK